MWESEISDDIRYFDQPLKPPEAQKFNSGNERRRQLGQKDGGSQKPQNKISPNDPDLLELQSMPTKFRFKVKKHVMKKGAQEAGKEKEAREKGAREKDTREEGSREKDTRERDSGPVTEEEESEYESEVVPIPSDVAEIQKKIEEALNEEPTEKVDEGWMRSFQFMMFFLIIFGRWPLTYSYQKKTGYQFRFSWICPGFIIFALTSFLTLVALITSGLNVLLILMVDKNQAPSVRTPRQIIEQGLMERHTMILIIILGSYGVNLIISFFMFLKRDEIAYMFTKWTRFIHRSSLKSGTCSCYKYVAIVAVNFGLVAAIYITLTVYRTSATFIGGPTVISIILIRQFLPDDYLNNFTDSPTHLSAHIFGLIIFFHVTITCYAYMYLFLWLIKSIENAVSDWNLRLTRVVEENFGDEIVKVDPVVQTKERTTYQLLYRDHIGLVRMLYWFNSNFAYTLEPFMLFMMVRIVYQFYLAALVLDGNGKPWNMKYQGKYFIRNKDYIAAALLVYENAILILFLQLSSAWLEDAAYESYDDLRKSALLKIKMTDKEAFFYLSMFESYTSTTRMSVTCGHFFSIDRYSILHTLSAIMSNFLVIYQFRPLFDMDTSSNLHLRQVFGDFLIGFEGLSPNHLDVVTDFERGQYSS